MRSALLWLFGWLTGYRFRKFLGETLTVPDYYEDLCVEKIRSKSTASLAAAGVFLSFSIAVLAAVMASKEYSETLVGSMQAGCNVWVSSAGIAIFLWFVIRQERVLSASGKKTIDYLILCLLLAASVVVFVVGPKTAVFDPFFSQSVLSAAFPLAGFLVMIGSILFQVISLEFYDSASGWRGTDKDAGRNLRFHLASLASHAFLFGLCFAVLGTFLLLSRVHFWTGSVATLVALWSLVAMTEIERELWTRKEPDTKGSPPQKFDNKLKT